MSNLFLNDNNGFISQAIFYLEGAFQDENQVIWNWSIMNSALFVKCLKSILKYQKLLQASSVYQVLIWDELRLFFTQKQFLHFFRKKKQIIVRIKINLYFSARQKDLHSKFRSDYMIFKTFKANLCFILVARKKCMIRVILWSSGRVHCQEYKIPNGGKLLARDALKFVNLGFLAFG
jgi:hypothetical protein